MRSVNNPVDCVIGQGDDRAGVQCHIRDGVGSALVTSARALTSGGRTCPTIGKQPTNGGCRKHYLCGQGLPVVEWKIEVIDGIRIMKRILGVLLLVPWSLHIASAQTSTSRS